MADETEQVSVPLAWFDDNNLQRLRDYAAANEVSLARAIADKAAQGLAGATVHNVNTGTVGTSVQADRIEGLSFG